MKKIKFELSIKKDLLEIVKLIARRRLISSNDYVIECIQKDIQRILKNDESKLIDDIEI